MIDDEAIAKRALRLIVQCEAFSDEQKAARDRALKSYGGEAVDVPIVAGRSKAVSMDVRATVKKVMPSIMRVLLANDKIVQYEPTSPGSEGMAAQATDYVNSVVVVESDVEKALHDAIFDALVLKTGILTWRAYERTNVTVKSFSGQPPDSLIGLDDVGEILDAEQDENGLVSYRLRQKETKVEVKMAAVPRGAFLIHPNATSIEDSPLVGERQSVSRSDLVSRGYDKDAVFTIASDNTPADTDSMERRGDDDSDVDADVSKAMEMVTVYDVVVRMDLDGDGIAELHRLVIAEDGTDSTGSTPLLLEHEYASEIPYAEVVAEREAHQFEGHSLAEDTIDIMSVKTSLLRQTLDNLTWQNNPQPFVQYAAMMDPEAFLRPEFGKPVWLNNGFTAAEAVQWSIVPFVADKSFPMLQYFDLESKQRNGITDASGGASADQLQGMSATAAGMMNESGVAQADMILRSLARGGIRRAFRGLLGLVIAHADQPRTIKLRDKWVQVDPRNWDAAMDCAVNVGLGAGSRERDMGVLNMIFEKQALIMTSLGPINPLVKPDQLYNTLAKMAETAGFPSADPYFTKPDPEEIAAQQQENANKPDPEQIKAQAKAAAQMEIERAKAEARSAVEQAQMQADLQVEQAKIEANAIAQAQKLESDKQLAAMRGELDMMKHRDQMRLEYAKLDATAMQQVPYAFG